MDSAFFRSTSISASSTSESSESRRIIQSLNTSVLAVLRDARFINFDDSLLSSIESSLCNGPLSFDCYPNLTVSLKDKNILKSMQLQIKTHNYHMIQDSIPVALIFKIHYKAMHSAFASKHLQHSNKGTTLLLQTDLNKANIVPNVQIKNITQYNDGRVKLSFHRHSTSSRFTEASSSSSTIDLGRMSRIPSVINLPYISHPNPPRHSTSDIPSTNLHHADYTTNIPTPVYIPEEEQSLPGSPTNFFSTPDRAIAELLIAGFSGQLKGWWDYHLTEADHLHILNAIQQYEDKTPVLDSSGNTVQDAVACLILTISLHFIGDPSHLKDKNAELLSNLRCKKLSDFQCTKLIPYDQLTYGELVSFTQKEGLQICQDLKLQKHLKWEMKRTKQELGSFCHHGSCSKSKHHHESKPPYKRSSHKYHKHYNSKYHSKEPEQPYYKKPYRKFTKHTKKPFHSNKPFDWKNATSGSSSSKPLLPLQNQIQVSSNFSKAKSKYFEKPKIQNIWTIEDGFPDHNVHATTASIFPKNFHFKSWDISKSQSFYENILQVTGSVTFKHFFKHPSHPDPAYSTCTIQRIISPDKWNIQKQNPHFPSYTYWDYEQAWFNAFLIQNQGYSHSWLFFFNTSIDTTSLPHWFQHWWDMFGCIPELLPGHPSVEEGFKLFKEAYRPIPSERHFKPITMFCAKFFLPWTQEEYLQILQSLAPSKEDESVSSNDSSSSSASPVISLGNDNEDDCYGILPPVKHSSKDVIKRR
ncbi:zf-CCHC domain-containing protein/MP domain-containing [Salix suchowensis]|nr:zf-CCHC domain-containing protein/MP domain-containing [Salix suchowensis]